MKKQLFYAEDLKDLALTVSYGLQMKLGRSWEITIRNDLEKAVRLANNPSKKWTICLVDLDFQDLRGIGQGVGLEQRDGVIIAKQIRLHNPNVPILLVTASAEQKMISKSPEIARLFNDYLPKEEISKSLGNLDSSLGLVSRIVERIEFHTRSK